MVGHLDAHERRGTHRPGPEVSDTVKKSLLDLVRRIRKREREACAESVARFASERRTAEQRQTAAISRRDLERTRLRETSLAEAARFSGERVRAADLVREDSFRTALEQRVKAHEESVRALSRDACEAAKHDVTARDALASAHARERAAEEKGAIARAEERAARERRDEEAVLDGRAGNRPGDRRP
jgi:hypothetical protein